MTVQQGGGCVALLQNQVLQANTTLSACVGNPVVALAQTNVTIVCDARHISVCGIVTMLALGCNIPA
jgi:hypothetical protein